ncbi:MAG: hypothetical protein HC764_21895 [Pleurocapsa sp. CRU_1_2]|nr:hypothetical protein [Pleurocapsa sp. CRU_1_2]
MRSPRSVVRRASGKSLHPEARKYLKMNAKGAIMEGLNMTIINNLPVPLVPVSLQQHYKEVHQNTTN